MGRSDSEKWEGLTQKKRNVSLKKWEGLTQKKWKDLIQKIRRSDSEKWEGLSQKK